MDIDDYMEEIGKAMRKGFDQYLLEHGCDPDYWDEREKRNQGTESVLESIRRHRNQGRA